LRTVDRVAVPANGQFVITEEEINADLAQYANLYEPIKDARVSILPDGIEASYKLYSLSSTFKTGLTVENGKIVVVNPHLSGVTSYAVDIDSVTATFEREVAELLARSGLQPTAVHLRDGSIVITTKPMSTLKAISTPSN
jgi:hypothetical protein